MRVVGKLQPTVVESGAMPVETGVKVLPMSAADTYEFLASAAMEPTSADIVDDWLDTQENSPVRTATRKREPRALREVNPLRKASASPQTSTSDEELHLFLADEPSAGDSADGAPKASPAAAPSTEEWPTDLLQPGNEWSVSRLVH